MGIDQKRSLLAAKLPGPLTMAYLPYAERIGAQTDFTRQQGHALMVHMPMAPVNGQMMNTPGMLHAGLTAGELKKKLEDNLSYFDGFFGVNNHMGSALTQNIEAMDIVMKTLNESGYYFIDSRTIARSVAADLAQTNNVPALVRDVFLDHEATLSFVKNALQRTEEIAGKNGIAIAIGHPKDPTIQALAEWIPDAKERGFVFVTADELIAEAYPQSRVAKQLTKTRARLARHLNHKLAPANGD